VALHLGHHQPFIAGHAENGLIPLPPLDGSKILLSFFSFETRARVMAFDRYGFFIVFLLLALNFFNGYFNLVYRAFISIANLIL